MKVLTRLCLLFVFLCGSSISVFAQVKSRANESYIQFNWNNAYQSQSFSGYDDDNAIDLSQVEGSPYDNPLFLPGKVIFEEDVFKDFYLRYNAYADEIELKEEMAADSANNLIKDPKMLTVINGEELRYYQTLITSEGVKTEGFLFLIYTGDKYELMQKRSKVYKEGIKAKTSFESSFPARFKDETVYYLATDGAYPIHFDLSKKALYDLVSRDNRGELKQFFKDEDIDLDNPTHLAAVFQFIESLAAEM